MLAVVAVIAGVLVLQGGGDESTDQAASPRNEVFLEAAAEPGPDPFTPSVAASPPPSTIPAPTAVPTTVAPATTARPRTPRPTAPPAAAIQSVAGNRPGLFGVVRSQPSCDGASLVTQLAADPAKASAFATIVGTTVDQLAARLDGFTALILQADTRVTNHGFDDGAAAPRQSLLEAGTAVLVDATGVPRVRCSCGNPLSEPEPVSGATFSGEPWPNFDPSIVSVVSPSPQPIPAFVTREVTTGQPIIRPTGTDGGSDSAAPPNTRLEPPVPVTTIPSTTVAPATTSTTTAATTTTGVNDANIPQPNTFVTRDGTVSASSETDDARAAARAIDGDPGTSWFGEATTSLQFTWTGRQDDLVTRVRVTGGSGFTRVKVEVVDEFGDPDFEQFADVAGDIVVRPGVEGRGIRLTFTPAPGADNAGFAELEVGVTR